MYETDNIQGEGFDVFSVRKTGEGEYTVNLYPMKQEMTLESVTECLKWLEKYYR